MIFLGLFRSGWNCIVHSFCSIHQNSLCILQVMERFTICKYTKNNNQEDLIKEHDVNIVFTTL